METPRFGHRMTAARCAINVGSLTVMELLQLHAATLARLKELGITRSNSNPVADLAESLVARILGGRVMSLSKSSYDVIVSTGISETTYQVKARRLTAENGSRQLGGIRGMDEQRFDYLVGMLFDENFAPLKAAIIPWEVVKANATYTAHTNSWKFILKDSVWTLPGVQDLRIEEPRRRAISLVKQAKGVGDDSARSRMAG
jgi:hypothetical protein